jgi:hypothetical protein
MPLPENPIDKYFYHFIRSVFFKTFIIVVLIVGSMMVVFAKPLLKFINNIGYGEQIQPVINTLYGTSTKTRTPKPTHTASATLTPTLSWHWFDASPHGFVILIPEEWTRTQEIIGTSPGDPPCTDYKIISPDGRGVVTISTWCGAIGGASLWEECPQPAQLIGEDNAVRYWRTDEYVYTMGGPGETIDSLSCRWGWKNIYWILEITYSQSDGIYDFETVEKMLFSIYSND